MKATNTVLFVHGAGDEGFEADKPMVASLKSALGNQYEVNSPKINSDESLPDFGWPAQIREHISAISGELILVGHSLGASMLLKYLSEYPVSKKISGLFLMATPFWGGDEEWKSGLKLKDNFANFLPAEIPVFLYHSQEDEVVPFSHLLPYSQHLPQAVVREIKTGGHQFGNNLTSVAEDIKSLK